MARMIKFFTNLLPHNGKIVKNPLTEVINNYPKQHDKLLPQIDRIWFKIGPYDSMFDLLNQNTEYLPTFGDSQRIPLAASQKMNNNCIENNSMLFPKTLNYKFSCNNTQQTMDGLISILKSNLKTSDINVEKQKLNSTNNSKKQDLPTTTESEQKFIVNEKKDQCQQRHNECIEEVANQLKETVCETYGSKKHETAINGDEKPKDQLTSTSPPFKNEPKETDQEGTSKRKEDTSKDNPCGSGIPIPNTGNNYKFPCNNTQQTMNGLISILKSNLKTTDINVEKQKLNSTDNSTKQEINCRDERNNCTEFINEVSSHLKAIACKNEHSGKNESANEDQKPKDPLPSTSPSSRDVSEETNQGCKDTYRESPDDVKKSLNKPNACTKFIDTVPRHFKEIVYRKGDSGKHESENDDEKPKDQADKTKSSKPTGDE